MATKILEHWGKCLDSAESKILLRRSEFKRVYKLEKSSKEDSPARLAEIGPWCTLPRVHLSAITLRVKERNMGCLRIAGLCVCWFPLLGVGMIQASDQVRGVGGTKGHCLAKTRWSWWSATSLLSTRDTALPLWLHKQKP